jgi:hypothetical protein
MGDTSLLHYERAVEQSRAKLSQDMADLCSPQTFANFTNEIKGQAFATRDAFWEKMKARAASNPAAVIAIGTGLAWQLLRKPPIASALIGLGLFSLWKTQASTAYDAAGNHLDYIEQSKEVLKKQAGQAYSAAADMAGKAQDVAAAKGSEVWEGTKEKMREVQGAVSGAVSDTTSKLKSSGEALLNEVRAKQHDVRDQVQEVATEAMDKVRDDESRNSLLLGVAGVAIAAALGIACQKRLSETLADQNV